MQIITPKGSINTEEDVVVFMFKDDNELNDFLANLANSPVKTSGIRLLTLTPSEMDFNHPRNKFLIDLLEGMDGIGGKTDDVLDAAIDKLTNVLNKGGY